MGTVDQLKRDLEDLSRSINELGKDILTTLGLCRSQIETRRERRGRIKQLKREKTQLRIKRFKQRLGIRRDPQHEIEFDQELSQRLEQELDRLENEDEEEVDYLYDKYESFEVLYDELDASLEVFEETVLENDEIEHALEELDKRLRKEVVFILLDDLRVCVNDAV